MKDPFISSSKCVPPSHFPVLFSTKLIKLVQRPPQCDANFFWIHFRSIKHQRIHAQNSHFSSFFKNFRKFRFLNVETFQTKNYQNPTFEKVKCLLIALVHWKFLLTERKESSTARFKSTKSYKPFSFASFCITSPNLSKCFPF